MLYVNYNKYGQAVGRGSIAPHDIQVSGAVVSYSGEMSEKSFEILQPFVSHSIVGDKQQRLYCHSAEAALAAAAILAENPNYARNGA